MRQLQEMQLSFSHVNTAMDSLIAIPCKDKFWQQNAKSAEKYL
jgi:hypothetical protein